MLTPRSNLKFCVFSFTDIWINQANYHCRDRIAISIWLWNKVGIWIKQIRTKRGTPVRDCGKPAQYGSTELKKVGLIDPIDENKNAKTCWQKVFGAKKNWISNFENPCISQLPSRIEVGHTETACVLRSWNRCRWAPLYSNMLNPRNTCLSQSFIKLISCLHNANLKFGKFERFLLGVGFWN